MKNRAQQSTKPEKPVPKPPATAQEIWATLNRLRADEPRSEVAKEIGRSQRTLEKWEAKFSSATSVQDVRTALDPDETRYIQVMRELFREKWYRGSNGFEWQRDDITRIASSLQIQVPKNLGDNIYAIRHGREDLPDEIRKLAPLGNSWLLLPNGRSGYKFFLGACAFLPLANIPPILIPDSTPQIVARYAQRDQQAALARIRYCRLVDIFLGVASFHLQGHLRTSMAHFSGSQTELDELYVGIDGSGVQYVIPIQARGDQERIGTVPLICDHYVCEEKFSSMVGRILAAKTVRIEQGPDHAQIFTIALIEVKVQGYNVTKIREAHYKLVPAALMS